jgi:alpha-tubulin suppressor-like RCC1 family protein
MARSSINQATLLDLRLDLFTAVCQQLDLYDLVRVAETCKRFRHGDSGLETAELPTKSPVVTALREHAFPGGALIPSSRPIGCFESWVSYLARCVRQRRCREASPIAAGSKHSLFLAAAGRLLACGQGAAVGHGDAEAVYSDPTPVTAMAGIRVRSVAAGLALGWDGRSYSWGPNYHGQLGQGDKLTKTAPAPVEGLEDVRCVAAGAGHTLAVTQSGSVFNWGCNLPQPPESQYEDREAWEEAKYTLRPIVVEGFGGVRVSRVCAGMGVASAIGEAGELFSWGLGVYWRLGHGDTEDQPSPKRVEALLGVRVSSVAVGRLHALALTADGSVYSWGENTQRAVLGNPHVERELLPKPVEALRGVRVGNVAASGYRSCAVADTGELLAWGFDDGGAALLGHGEQGNCPLPKPIATLRGVKMDAVATGEQHTLARADDGRVFAWGSTWVAETGALGLGASVSDAERITSTPQCIPALRVACAL